MVYIPAPLESRPAPVIPRKEKINTTIVFPNPATDHLEVLCRDLLPQPFDVTLYDVSGTILKTERFFSSHFMVKLDNIPAGLYIFKMQDGKGMQVTTQKILILKR